MPTNRARLRFALIILLITSLLATIIPTPQSPIRAMPAPALANQPNFPDPPRRDTDVPTVTIQGTVTDATGRPVASLRVRLMLPDGTIVQEIITDTNGYYTFSPEQTDRYQLWVLNRDGRPLRWEGDQLFSVDDQVDVQLHDLRLYEVLGQVTEAAIIASMPTLNAAVLTTTVPSAASMATESSQVPLAGEIQGTVTAADTGEPVRFVSVVAYNTDGEFASSGRTDSAGQYTIGLLEPGSYRIGFLPSGSGSTSTYHDEYYNDKLTLENADTVVVTTGQDVTGIDAVLGLAAQISGTVTTADGNRPMSDLRVTLYTLDEQFVDAATTDANGRYHLEKLTPGEYKLLFTPTNNATWRDYLPEYFNDQPDFADADTITLVTADRRVIDAQLIRSGRLLGTVTDESNSAPLAGIEVSVYDENALVVATVPTTASGIYTVTGLATGNYRVRFVPPASGVNSAYLAEYHNNQPTLALADGAAVTVGAETTVDAGLTPGGQIKGQITDQTTNNAIGGIHAEAYDRYGVLQASATSATDGTYTLTGLASGDYWLYFEAPDSGAAARYGSAHHLDAVEVTAPGVVNNLNAQLVQLGQISGRVTAADGGAGLGGVSVRLYDGDGLFVDSVTTDSSGIYTTTGLLAGSYTLYAMPFETTVSAAYLPAFYNGKASLLQADPVQVPNVGIIPNINFTLTRGGAISGAVTAAAGGAARRDVNVILYDTGYQRLKSTETTGAGTYRFQGLSAGSYLVQFVPQRFGESSAYASRYYQGKSDPATADRVQVTGAATTPNINGVLPLRSTVTGQISGNVTEEATNQPLVNVRVRARDANGRIVADTTTAADGNYALVGLNSGRYRVQFERTQPNAAGFYYIEEYYNNQSTESGADLVAVTAPNVTANINTALALAGQISGHVTAADTGNSVAAQVLLYDDTGARVATATLSSFRESYTFAQVSPGDYRLYFAPVALPYIPAYSGNAATLATATPVTVNSGQRTENVDSTLAHGAQIVGQLLAADTGFPIDYNNIELYDVTSGQLLDTMRTDSEGHYGTFGLANGSYIIRAKEDNRYLAIDSATITIAASTDLRTVNLQLQPAASILGRVMAASTKLPIGGV